MKKILALLLSAVMVFSLAACGQANPEQTTSDSTSMVEQTLDGTKLTNGESLKAWNTNAGWTAFYTFTRNENLNEAWEAAAKAFGPSIGMEQLDAEGLKAMNVQICGLEDDIAHFEFTDTTITATDSTGKTVFSHPYTYLETIDNAMEGDPVYVYKTDDSDAGKYTYLCLTLPAVESDEGGVMRYFRLRYSADNYRDLFAENFDGVTGIIADGATSEKDLDYTIRLLYGAEMKQ